GVGGGRGAAEAGGQQQGEDLTMGEFQLGVGGQMAVDNLGDLHAFQQRTKQGQGTQVDDFLRAHGSMPSEAHVGSSLKNKSQSQERYRAARSRCRFYSRAAVKMQEKTKVARWSRRL